MKKLLVLPLLFLLSACVSYYYPQTALEDGVYYADDDPSYVVRYGGYPGAAYYPWSSLDYFYLGYYPYPRYGFYYGYSFGMGYVYSPWHYPYGYYGYYSPWYASYYHYPFYPAWRPYNGYCSHYSGCDRWKNSRQRDDRRNRYAGIDDPYPGKRDDVIDGEEGPVTRSTLPPDDSIYATSPFSRYVSVAPAGYSGNRGIVIRNNGATKVGKSRLEPDRSVPVATMPRVNGGMNGQAASSSVSAPAARSISRATSRSSGRSRSSFSSSSRAAKSPTRRDID